MRRMGNRSHPPSTPMPGTSSATHPRPMGQVYEPLLEFAPSGPANHAPGLWSKQKTNFAPRLAIAYSPNEKTSIRAGFGLYFDHYGEGIVNTFDQNRIVRLEHQRRKPGGRVYHGKCSPLHRRPQRPFQWLRNNQRLITYPYTAPSDSFCGFAITWGADNKLKTPYAEAMDFPFSVKSAEALPSSSLTSGAWAGTCFSRWTWRSRSTYVDPAGRRRLLYQRSQTIRAGRCQRRQYAGFGAGYSLLRRRLSPTCELRLPGRECDAGNLHQ